MGTVDGIQVKPDASEKENTWLQNEVENTAVRISELEKRVAELNAENVELKRDISESLAAFQKIDEIYRDAPESNQHSADVTKQMLKGLDRRLIGIISEIGDVLKDHELIREEIVNVRAVANPGTADENKDGADVADIVPAAGADEIAGKAEVLKTVPAVSAGKPKRITKEVIERASDYSRFGRKSRLSFEERSKLLAEALTQND